MKRTLKVLSLFLFLATLSHCETVGSVSKTLLNETTTWLSGFMSHLQKGLRMPSELDDTSALDLMRDDVGAAPAEPRKTKWAHEEHTALYRKTEQVFSELASETRLVTDDDGLKPAQAEEPDLDNLRKRVSERLSVFPENLFETMGSLDDVRGAPADRPGRKLRLSLKKRRSAQGNWKGDSPRGGAKGDLRERYKAFRAKVRVRNKMYEMPSQREQAAYRRHYRERAERARAEGEATKQRHLRGAPEREAFSFKKKMSDMMQTEDEEQVDAEEVQNDQESIQREFEFKKQEEQWQKEAEDKEFKSEDTQFMQTLKSNLNENSGNNTKDSGNDLFKYVTRDGKTEVSKFREREVKLEVSPLHYLKMSVLLHTDENDELEIKNLLRLKEVAEEHVNNHDLAYDLDSVLDMRIRQKNELEEDYYIEKNKRTQKNIQTEELKLNNLNHKKVTQSMRDDLEGDGISESDRAEGLASPSEPTERTWEDPVDLGTPKGSVDTFVNGSEASASARPQKDGESAEMDLLSEEVDNAVEKATAGEVKVMTLADLKTKGLTMDDFESATGDEGFKRKKGKRSKITRDRPDIDENDVFAQELRESDYADAQDRSFDSRAGEVGSENNHIQEALNSRIGQDDMHPNNMMISFKTSEIIDEDIKIDEDDNFRYYYQPQYIFQVAICQLFITEIEAFQYNVDINLFICQYFASLFAKTEFIEYVEYAKATLGSKLVQVFSRYERQFLNILEKYLINMHSETKSKLKHNLEQVLPKFLDNLLTLIEEIATEYIETIQRNYDEIIEPLLDQLTRNNDAFISSENISIKRENALRVLVATYTVFQYDPDIYRIRLLETLNYYRLNLEEEELHSEFYEILPDLMITDRYSLCRSYEVFGANNYYGDCGYLLMEAGIKDRVLSKCRQFFISIFEVANGLPGFCERLGTVKKFTEEIFMKAVMELSKNLLLYNNINLHSISRVIYDFMRVRLEQVNNIIEMYQHSTSKKVKFTNEVKTRMFPLFNFLRLSFTTSTQLESKVKIIDNYFNEYLGRIRKYRLGFSKKVMPLILQIFGQLTKNERSNAIKNKLNNLTFRRNMKYFCVVSNDLRLSAICDSIFDKVTFPFLYRYFNYDFVFEYINSYIQRYVNDFDLVNNNVKKITSFFKIRIRQTIVQIRTDLINSLYLFSPELLENLDKDVLILILIYAKTIKNDAKHKSFEHEIMPHMNVLVSQKLDRLKNVSIEMGLITFFKDIAKEILNFIQFENVMYFDKLIIFFIREVTDFKARTKINFMDNLWVIYTHFDNWEYLLNHYMETYKVINTDYLMLTCREERQDPSEVCQRGNTNSPFVINSCPPFSTPFENGICMSNCPEGFADLGLFCQKPRAIFKKIYRSPDKCDANLGCVKMGDDFYIDKCPKLYFGISVMCFPLCPYGTIDQGNSCKKKIVGQLTYYY